MHEAAGEFPEAFAVATNLAAEDPWFHDLVGELHLDRGEAEDAAREVGLAGRAAEPSYPEVFRCALRARLGKPDDARKLVSELERDSTSHSVRATRRAGLAASLDDTETALAFLQRDLEEGTRALSFDYQQPWFDSIRHDPRFVALLRECNLPTEPPPRLARTRGRGVPETATV